MQMPHVILVLILLALVIAFGLWVMLNAIASAGPVIDRPRVQVAATTFIGSIIVKIDQGAGQLTVRTTTGTVWTLPVADPALLSGLKEGDRVSVEIDANDRIVKLGKVEGAHALAPERDG